ncbi:MAG TPA: nitronate monooxygenase [Gammaproteobacteria bacterium]|nr:nitronate monooxygenase [Gammaproteobacteria bacterium]
MEQSNGAAGRLSLVHPIIQAPMAGGADTPALVAAVSEAGGIGFIGAAYLSPAQILEAARAVRERTSRPFGINLFAPQPAPQARGIERAIRRVAPYYEELGLPPPAPPAVRSLPFDEQIAACIESGAAAFSFTFGVPPPDTIAAVKSAGLFVLGTATSVEEAVLLEKAGVDAVVAQGVEAGGHRGTFVGDFGSAMIGTMALVPQVADAVRVPVVASGGIMDGRGIAAAVALGASAVQMGTAFLTSDEAGIPEAYKQQIVGATERDTRVTTAFSGRPARGIVNRFMTEVDAGAHADEILPFPLQNALTRPLRTEAAKRGRAEFLSLWAGQGARMARRMPAARLVAALAEEIEATFRRVAGARPLS